MIPNIKVHQHKDAKPQRKYKLITYKARSGDSMERLVAKFIHMGNINRNDLNSEEFKYFLNRFKDENKGKYSWNYELYEGTPYTFDEKQQPNNDSNMTRGNE